MKIKNVLFCEDIRQEVGGKASTMGLLGDSINTNLPADGPETVSLQLAALVTLENEGKQYKSVALSSDLFVENAHIGQIRAQVKLSKDGTISHVPLPKFVVNVAASLDITLKIKVLSEDDLIAEQEATLHVRLNREEVTPN